MTIQQHMDTSLRLWWISAQNSSGKPFPALGRKQKQLLQCFWNKLPISDNSHKTFLRVFSTVFLP